MLNIPRATYNSMIVIFIVFIVLLSSTKFDGIDNARPSTDNSSIDEVILDTGQHDAVLADEPFEGYTLYTPNYGNDTYLLDMDGQIVHAWPGPNDPALSVYFYGNDGSIIRTTLLEDDDTFRAGGFGGRIQIIDWNGTVTWQFDYQTSEHCLHHDIEVLPNGNILMIAWEMKYNFEVIQAGRDPALFTDTELWPETIIEVEPTGPTTGDIVWEWHVWDHLIQDYDPGKDNYGVVEDHPELLDINHIKLKTKDWIHFNAIDYNEALDQILVTSRFLDEFYIIDHSTNTSEAAVHTGGLRGRGGDLLYRWGNPQGYGLGTADDRILYAPHDASWIEPGCPGEGNILVFNNGKNRPVTEYSSVEEIAPPIDGDGNYTWVPGTIYEPADPLWNYTAPVPTDFYASASSGAQRLPNGNTLICEADEGYFFEVTQSKSIVWDHDNSLPVVPNDNVFKVRRYAPDHPALPGQLYDLTLVEGWNFISLPCAPLNTSLAMIMENIEGKWDRIMVYNSTDADHWKTFSTLRPETLNDLHNLNSRIGFWLNVTEAGVVFKFWGNMETSTNIQLHAGWNLVGYPSLTQRNVTNALAGTGYTSIESFNATAPYLMSQIEDSYIMKPGEAYWIKVPSDTVWTVDW